MVQPTAVKRAAARADDQIKELAKAAQQGAGAPQTAAEEPAAPAEEAREPITDNQAVPADTSAEETAAPPADEAAEPSEDASAEQRYRVLQGKYRSETRRQREQIERLTRQVDNMTALLARVSTPQPETAPKEEKAAPPTPAFTAPSASELSKREREEFGEELLDAAARHAMAQMAPAFKALEAELKALRSDVKSARQAADTAQAGTASAKRMTINDRLDAEMPEWRDINVDEDFKEWLRGEDEYSGEARGTLLLRAYERGDARRVLRFFRAYKAEHAGAPDDRALEGGAEDTSATRKPKVDPAALVAPGKGRSAPRNGAQQAKIQWTPETVALFYRDVQNGMYKNDPAERDRLEADIFAAQKDGRL